MLQTRVFSLEFSTAVNIPMANPDLFVRLRLTKISSPSKAGPQNSWRGCQPLICPIQQFCDNCKIPSSSYYLKEAEMEIAMFAHFKEYHGNHKNFKSLYYFGGRCLKIRDVRMDFEPYFKVHNLVFVHPKSIILRQTNNLNMIFHVVVSVYRFLAPVPC